MSLAVQIVGTTVTFAAVVVALVTGVQAIRLQRHGLAVEGRRQAASRIAAWLQSAETGILSWHDPANWRALSNPAQPETVTAPSQALMGPSIETAIARFDSIKGEARLSFGPGHEVIGLVGEVIAAIQQVADRGLIHSAAQSPTPRDYVDGTFVPLSRDLFEALAEACELRARGGRVPRSGVHASDNMPAVFGP